MENFVLDQVGQVSALFKPLRIELLAMLDEPRTCGQLAQAFQSSPQKIYYHLKVLEGAGLVKKVSEKRVRGIMEGYYQAAADSYWLSPQLVDQLGGERGSKDQLSIGYLLGLAEQLQREVAPLLKAKGEIPSLGISAQIRLRDGTERASFLDELQEVVGGLAEKYGSSDSTEENVINGDDFRLVLACYPHTGSG
jgi:DNA-binding transcriptional ArsR family regulator